jgi:hypothetical protein
MARLFAGHDSQGHSGDFEAQLQNERRRAARSGRPFVVLHVHADQAINGDSKLQDRLFDVIYAGLRETDWVGRSQASTLGVICTETGSRDEDAAGGAIRERLTALIRASLPNSIADQIQLSVECFPVPVANPTPKKQDKKTLANTASAILPNLTKNEILACP